MVNGCCFSEFCTGFGNHQIVVFHHRRPGTKFASLGMQDHGLAVPEGVSPIAPLDTWIDPTSDLPHGATAIGRWGTPSIPCLDESSSTCILPPAGRRNPSYYMFIPYDSKRKSSYHDANLVAEHDKVCVAIPCGARCVARSKS